MRRIGIDVGGTNTDAVLRRRRRCRACGQDADDRGCDGRHRRGARRVVGASRGRARRHRRGRDRDDPFRQRGGAAAGARPGRGGADRIAGRRLLAAVLRLAARTSPSSCRGEVFMLEGGHDYDGRPIVPFDEDGMRRRGAAHPGERHPVGRGRRDILAGRSGLRGAGARNPRRGMPRGRRHLVARSRPHRSFWSARTPPC